jgi:predicted amidophosphoribosyltransferase
MRGKIVGKTVVVMDDVATTCSTLREIAKVLKRNGAKEVWGVVFAREEFARDRQDSRV